MLRSLLFLPGNTPNMLINAGCLGADALIFDLEDAVSPAEKDAARILVRNTLRHMEFPCARGAHQCGGYAVLAGGPGCGAAGAPGVYPFAQDRNPGGRAAA